METEQDRLERMYGELSNERVEALYEDRDDLTDEARLALGRVMRERGMTATPEHVGEVTMTRGQEHEEGFTPGIPGMFPSSAGAVEKALEPGGAGSRGMVNLITFFDGHELTRACAALDEADVDLVLEPSDRDALSGAPPSFAIWVSAEDKTMAEGVLRQEMGLFPLAEVGDDAGKELDGEMVTLGEFETDEAEQVATALGQQGIFCRMDAEEDGSALVEVRGEDLERALGVVTAALGI